MRVEKHTNEVNWKRARENSIGASEVAAVLGLNPYKSAYTLWAEKTGRIAPMVNNIATRCGHALEGLATELYEEHTGERLFNPGDYTIFYDATMPFLSCTPDRIVIERHHYDAEGVATGMYYDAIQRPVELKSIGERMAARMKEGEVQNAHLVQLQAQIAVLGTAAGDLACLIANRDFQVFPFERHDRLIRGIRTKVSEFWDRIQNDDPPEVDGSISTTTTLREIYAEDNAGVIELGTDADELLAHLEEVKEDIKELSDEESAIKNQLIAMLAGNGLGLAGIRKIKFSTIAGSEHIQVDAALAHVLETHQIPFEMKTRKAHKRLIIS